MPRKPRVNLAGVAAHIIQRGNNRQVIFACDDDMRVYLTWLKDYAKQFEVSLHSWVLMTNHVHLLCTPGSATALSAMMQAVGRRYVQYFNRSYKRSGTLWEGRFRSCLVQEERYLLQLYRYIELNPVRAGMVDDPANYSWSSYQGNGLGKTIAMLTPHSSYLRLGHTDKERQHNYRDLFKYQIDGQLIDDIRKATNKGLALGNERFIAEIEHLTGTRLQAAKRGRRTGWRKTNASAGLPKSSGSV
ncbi:transposase [Ectothiorhodospiraceae bacterium BW-2]|nr:transposase [Ectothiorhodospiraceae bacterium BW-2]